jgi:hypothetical protein
MTKSEYLVSMVSSGKPALDLAAAAFYAATDELVAARDNAAAQAANGTNARQGRPIGLWRLAAAERAWAEADAALASFGG